MMLKTYQILAKMAENEFDDIVTRTRFVGGSQISPDKLRLDLKDRSFIDIWLSSDGDYAYHWERRRQTGEIYRWDNAPHHPFISTFPDHFHKGNEYTVTESRLGTSQEDRLRHVLTFARQHMELKSDNSQV